MFLSMNQWAKLRYNLSVDKIKKSDIISGVGNPDFIWKRLEKIIFQEEYPKHEDFSWENDSNDRFSYYYYKDVMLYNGQDYTLIALNLFHMSTKDLI